MELIDLVNMLAGEASKICNDFSGVFGLAGWAILIIKIVVPIILIFVGMFDLAKAVTEKKEYKQYSNEIKKTLISNRDCWKELSRNNQIKLRLIMLSPFLYHCIFRVYNRFFMKKIYE